MNKGAVPFIWNRLLLSTIRRVCTRHPYTLEILKSTRNIKSLHISDRVVLHSCCNNVLVPRVRPKLIYDNGASLEGNGTVTASNLTLTGGSIKSSNYATSGGSVTAGTYINLSTGAISTKNFSLTSSGTMTAKNASLSGSFETGADDDGAYLKITDGKVSAYVDNNRIGALGATCNSDGTVRQYALLGSTNYQGVLIGTLYNHDVTPYYRMNYDTAYSSMGCRHWFSGDIKFTNGRVRSCLDFADNYGLSWGGNIALRYYNGSSPYGVWLGIGGEYACPTVINGSEIKLAVTAYTNAGVVVTSDKRKKQNIKDLDTRYTALMDNLSGKSFQYKEYKPEQTNCGFVAQDVIAAMQAAGLDLKDFGAVNDRYGDGSEYSLDYVQFIPILWDIVKNQQAEIDNLRRLLS